MSTSASHTSVPRHRQQSALEDLLRAAALYVIVFAVVIVAIIVDPVHKLYCTLRHPRPHGFRVAWDDAPSLFPD